MVKSTDQGHLDLYETERGWENRTIWLQSLYQPSYRAVDIRHWTYGQTHTSLTPCLVSRVSTLLLLISCIIWPPHPAFYPPTLPQRLIPIGEWHREGKMICLLGSHQGRVERGHVHLQESQWCRAFLLKTLAFSSLTSTFPSQVTHGHTPHIMIFSQVWSLD